MKKWIYEIQRLFWCWFTIYEGEEDLLLIFSLKLLLILLLTFFGFVMNVEEPA
jgi:hypothetical protein